MSRLYNLTDEQFALLEPLLQEHRDPRGRKPNISDRHTIEGILYVFREGCRWHEGSHSAQAEPQTGIAIR